MGSRQTRQRPPQGPPRGTSLTCLTAASLPPGRAVAASRLDTAPSVLARRLAYCWGRGGLSLTQERPPGPGEGGAGAGVPCSKEAGARGWRGEEAVPGPGLTCSAGPGEPAGPLPARTAGVARPGGRRPGAAAVGSLVDGSGGRGEGGEAAQRGPTLTGRPHRRLPGLLGSGQASPRPCLPGLSLQKPHQLSPRVDKATAGSPERLLPRDSGEGHRTAMFRPVLGG